MLRTEQGQISLKPSLIGYWLLMLIVAVGLTSCATTAALSPTAFESHPNAVTVPYRISSAGRIVLDVAINDNEPKPFVLDTGANVSVIYEGFSEGMGLHPTGETVLVRGLVSIGRRPIIEKVDFVIGENNLRTSRIAVLETPPIRDGAVGLLGTDVLSDYVVLFNKESLMATLIPSEQSDPDFFDGWRTIPLKNNAKGRSDIGLYFGETLINRTIVQVLIDTGSNSNFINWRLATINNNVKRFERNLRKKGKLQGALESTDLKMDTVLTELEIGQKYWSEIDVTVIELDPLITIAPVDRPMMIAGAGMFTPWTIAFDFGRNNIHMFPHEGDVKPPEHYWGYTPP